jgi:hypothetical protein
MNVEVSAAEPSEVEADFPAVAGGGERLRELDPLLGGRLAGTPGDSRR